MKESISSFGHFILMVVIAGLILTLIYPSVKSKLSSNASIKDTKHAQSKTIKKPNLHGINGSDGKPNTFTINSDTTLIKNYITATDYDGSDLTDSIKFYKVKKDASGKEVRVLLTSSYFDITTSEYTIYCEVVNSTGGKATGRFKVLVNKLATSNNKEITDSDQEDSKFEITSSNFQDMKIIDGVEAKIVGDILIVKTPFSSFDLTSINSSQSPLNALNYKSKSNGNITYDLQELWGTLTNDSKYMVFAMSNIKSISTDTPTSCTYRISIKKK